jgi:hypothetical protein
VDFSGIHQNQMHDKAIGCDHVIKTDAIVAVASVSPPMDERSFVIRLKSDSFDRLVCR